MNFFKKDKLAILYALSLNNAYLLLTNLLECGIIHSKKREKSCFKTFLKEV